MPSFLELWHSLLPCYRLEICMSGERWSVTPTAVCFLMAMMVMLSCVLQPGTNSWLSHHSHAWDTPVFLETPRVSSAATKVVPPFAPGLVRRAGGAGSSSLAAAGPKTEHWVAEPPQQVAACSEAWVGDRLVPKLKLCLQIAWPLLPGTRELVLGRPASHVRVGKRWEESAGWAAAALGMAAGAARAGGFPQPGSSGPDGAETNLPGEQKPRRDLVRGWRKRVWGWGSSKSAFPLSAVELHWKCGCLSCMELPCAGGSRAWAPLGTLGKSCGGTMVKPPPIWFAWP